MRDNKGRFIKGISAHPKTEFKKGHHWRPRKAHWDRHWLYQEYVTNARSADDIAQQASCTENNILYWLHKHSIPRRSIRAIRSTKYWGARGSDNPMWNGGISSERQSFCNSLDWAWTIKKVYGRDKKTCQRCGKQQTKCFKNFHIHHRVSFKERDLRINLDNLVLLCAKCHHWVHSRPNKEQHFIGAFQISLNGGD